VGITVTTTVSTTFSTTVSTMTSGVWVGCGGADVGSSPGAGGAAQATRSRIRTIAGVVVRWTKMGFMVLSFVVWKNSIIKPRHLSLHP
jgi:hypothetical protein